MTYLVWQYQEPLVGWEPWYQYAIDAAMIVGAPLIGSYVAEAAEDMHRDTQMASAEINRFHFLWLWFAAYWYAVGLITPIARFYALQNENSIIAISCF